MKCSVCGDEFGNGAYCQHCHADRVTGLGKYEGYKRPESSAKGSNQSSETSTILSNNSGDGNDVCPFCGEIIPTGADFCPFCGKKLKLVCPNCGNNYSAAFKYCPSCGKSYSEAEDFIKKREQEERERLAKEEQERLEAELRRRQEQAELERKRKIDRQRLEREKQQELARKQAEAKKRKEAIRQKRIKDKEYTRLAMVELSKDSNYVGQLKKWKIGENILSVLSILFFIAPFLFAAFEHDAVSIIDLICFSVIALILLIAKYANSNKHRKKRIDIVYNKREEIRRRMEK